MKGEGSSAGPEGWHLASGGYQARYARPLDGGGFVAVGKGEMAWVEASLPKRAGQWESLDLDQALTVAAEMIEDACQFVTPAAPKALRGTAGDAPLRKTGRRMDPHLVSVANPKVVRLDLVRELRLHNPDLLSPILEGLGNIHHPGRVTSRRYKDAARGRAETLSVGPKAWKMTLYDKHEETRLWSPRGEVKLMPAPKGSLRAEARLHADQLHSAFARKTAGTVTTMADLEEAKLRDLTRGWWDRTGCGATVTGHVALADLVWSQPWSEAVRGRFLAWAQNPGITYSNRHLEADCRRRARDLEIARGEQLEYDVRLDYDLGHEVLAA